MSLDCEKYEDCIDINPVEIKMERGFVEILAVSCWGVYCDSGSKVLLKYKKGEFSKDIINRGQKYVSNALKKYVSFHSHIEDMFLAGDNIYSIAFDTNTTENNIKNINEFKEKLKKNPKAGYNIKKQLSLGFEECFNKVGVSRFFIGVGNHDIENCEILNYQKNYNSPTWNFPSLYYNVIYTLQNNITINVIVIDTNMYEKEALMCNGKPFPEFIIEKQEKWATSFGNKYNWTIVVGHIPFVSYGHKVGKSVYNKRLGKLIEQIKPHIYFCGDEHDQQFIYNKNMKLSLIVAGSGGTVLDSIIKTKLPDGFISYYSNSSYGFVSFLITKKEIRIRYITTKNIEKSKISLEVNIDREGNLIEK
jgi:hypothetical protein